jgi:predicted phage tail protein
MVGIVKQFREQGLCSNTHSRCRDLRQQVIYNDDEQSRDPATFLGKPVSELTRAMRLIEIAIGVILLGGAAWTTVKTYKGRGMSSIFVLAFAVFLVALGLSFLFGAFGALLHNLRFGSEWLK